jgi:cytochrome c oxidase assembly protein subunit 11
MAQGSKRNRLFALAMAGVVAGMVGLSFAAVPLYRLFCQVTGFAGTPQVAEAAPDAPGERQFTVRFNSDVSPQLPWHFKPQVRAVEVKAGEPKLIFFEARNDAAVATVGTATFNVTPLKAGQYFNKVQCFCFDEQPLAPGEEVQMGVSFFVDPAIMDDPALVGVGTITLSYTFFRSLDDNESGQGDEPRTSALDGAGDLRFAQASTSAAAPYEDARSAR